MTIKTKCKYCEYKFDSPNNIELAIELISHIYKQHPDVETELEEKIMPVADRFGYNISPE